jgi:PAS domain-containing protein
MFLGKGQPEEKEERVLRDRKERVEQVVKYPIKDEFGEIVRIMGISWDITAKKEKEEGLEGKNKELAALLEARNAELKEIQEEFQLEQAERRRLEEKHKNIEGLYSNLFENTGTAVALVEESKIISKVNGEFQKYFGHSKAQIEGGKIGVKSFMAGSRKERENPSFLQI